MATLPTIYLKPLTSWEKAQKKRATLPAPLKVLTSLKTTAVLGATLGALLSPASALGLAKGVGRFVIKRPLLSLVGVPTAYGVLKSSAKAREITKTALDPREAVKRGKALGEIIEDPKKTKDILGITEDMTTKEKILAGLKTGGKVGGIIAGVGALGYGVKKVLPTAQKLLAERRAKKELDLIKDQERAQQLSGLKQVGFTEPQRVGVGGIPVATPSQIKPVGAPQPTKTGAPLYNVIQISVR